MALGKSSLLCQQLLGRHHPFRLLADVRVSHNETNAAPGFQPDAPRAGVLSWGEVAIGRANPSAMWNNVGGGLEYGVEEQIQDRPPLPYSWSEAIYVAPFGFRLSQRRWQETHNQRTRNGSS